MENKPSNLLYGVDDLPPWKIFWLLSVLHVIAMSGTLVLAVVLVTEIGGTARQIEVTVAMTMIAAGFGTMLQAIRWKGIGSGYLCPSLPAPNFFAATIGAAWLGGLPLMRGMIIAAGLTEIVFAKFFHRLEFLFPNEITGLVVFMVGFGLIPIGTAHFFGINYEGDPIQDISLIVSALTLFIMAGVSVWGSANFKLYGVLIGMIVGYGLCLATGLLSAADFSAVGNAAWIGLPLYEGMWEISFSWSLLPVFIIVSICGALKSFGNLTLCQKFNSAGPVQIDMRRAGDGLTADGLTVVASGLLGGFAASSSSTNVAITGATGVTSRWIGLAAGGLFILLGFSPKLSAVLSVMPAPVSGALLLLVICHLMLSGLQIILSTSVDTPKLFVIGIALAFGISLSTMPELYAGVFPWLLPLFDSSLTFATVVAVVLNQVLRMHRKKMPTGDIVKGDPKI